MRVEPSYIRVKPLYNYEMRAAINENKARSVHQAILQMPILRTIQKKLRRNTNQRHGPAGVVRVYA